MFAGTIARLEAPATEPLTSWSRNGTAPVLVVENTQGDLNGGAAAQTGQACGRVEANQREIDYGEDAEGRPFIDIERVRGVETLATGWVADVTDAAVVVAGSVGADDKEFPFPFDLFTARTGQRCRRQAIDVETLGRTWSNDGVLSDVWMAGDRVGDSVNIRYHSTTENDAQNVNIGLGYERSYEGSLARGIVYESGYIAVWRDWTASKFVSFVVDELLPFCHEFDYEAEQADFDDFGGS